MKAPPPMIPTNLFSPTEHKSMVGPAAEKSLEIFKNHGNSPQDFPEPEPPPKEPTPPPEPEKPKKANLKYFTFLILFNFL
jgi:hypothetical protein